VFNDSTDDLHSNNLIHLVNICMLLLLQAVMQMSALYINFRREIARFVITRQLNENRNLHDEKVS